MTDSETPLQERGQTSHTFWDVLLELWMLLVLASFFVIRIAGSHTAQHLWEALRRHTPA